MKIIIVFAVFFSISGCFQEPPLKIGLEGKKMPSFSFLLMDSITKLNTENIYPGKPFVMCYFSPDCPFCRAQIRDIISHERDLGNIKFYLITTHSYNEVKNFATEFNLGSFKNIVTGIDYTNDFAKYFYITSVPYLAIYDKEKRLKQVLVGKTDFGRIKTEVGYKD